MKLPYIFILAALLYVFNGAGTVFAAPDLITQDLTFSGSLTPGSTLTFSAHTKNVGTVDMNTTNSYNFIKIGAGYPPTTQLWYWKFGILGNYAYTSNVSGSSVDIYDISNPGFPVYTGKLGSNACLAPSSFTITPTGHLYVGGGSCAAGIYGFSIYNAVGNPANPPLVGKGVFSRLTSATTFAVSGNYAYVGEEDTGFVDTFDISNPTSPIKVSEVSLGSITTIAPRSIAISGRYAYVAFVHTDIAAAVPEFAVLDLINPGNPQLVATLDLYPSMGSGSVDVGALTTIISGNYAYVGVTNLGGGGGPFVVDISNPLNPTKGAWSGGAANQVMSLKINDRYLYAVDQYNGFYTYDISNPMSPVKKAVGPGPDISIDNNRYSDLSPSSQYLYVDRWGNGGSVGNARIETYEPHTFSRYCVTNTTYSATDATNCQNGTATRIGGKDFDTGRLTVNASYATSTTWTATLGTHTVYVCADVKGTNGYDGVAESNETNNCTSTTFTISSFPNLSVTNISPTAGTLIKEGNPITFNGNAVNGSLAISEGYWAGAEVDWGSNGGVIPDSGTGYDLYCAAPNSSTMLGAFNANQTKQLGCGTINIPLGNHRYRFNVDATGLLGESNELDNRSTWTSFKAISGTLTTTSNVTTVNGGETITLTWETENTAGLTCTVEGGGQSWTGLNNTVGVTSNSLYANTLYTLSCDYGTLNTNDDVLLSWLSITVNTTPELSVNRRVVDKNSPVILTWNTHNGNEASCTLTSNATSQNLIRTTNGDLSTGSATIEVNSRTTYTLSCPNPLGGAPLTDSVIVEVISRGFES